jgi:hypothetical protein
LSANATTLTSLVVSGNATLASLIVGSTAITEKTESNVKYLEIDGNVVITGSITFGGKGVSSGSSSGVTTLEALKDVKLGVRDNGQSLVYENGYWVNKKVGLDSTTLWDTLATVDATKVIDSSHIPDLRGKYLSLSGGTITGDFSVSNPNSGIHTISIQTNNGTAWLGYNADADHWFVTDKNWYKSYSIIHSGNIGGYALKKDGSNNMSRYITIDTDLTQMLVLRSSSGENRGQLGADTNTGELIWRNLTKGESWRYVAFTDSNVASADHATSADVVTKTYGSQSINFTRNESKLRLISSTYGDAVANGFPKQYISGLSVITDYTGWQMVTFGSIGTPNPYFRSFGDDGRISEWKQIAFLTDNVASATKLQTARTIWGQSFDGSKDIVDPAKMSLLYFRDIDGTSTSYIGRASSVDNSIYLSVGNNNDFVLTTNREVRLKATASGNVLIGTTADYGYKLAVNGTLNAGETTLSNLGVTYDVTIGDTLGVIGKSTLGELSAGVTTLTSLSVTNDINAKNIYTTGIVGGSTGWFYNMEPKPVNGTEDYSGTVGTSNKRWANAYFKALDIKNRADVGSLLSAGNITCMGCLRARGNLYVGASDDTQNLFIYGNLTTTGSITFGTASDRRLKDNIKSMTDKQATFVLKALNPVTYQWNSTAYELGKLSGVSDGFIADEYEKLIPNSGRDIWANYRAINYERATSYLVKGWQNHETRLEKAERRIKELENELNQYRRAEYGSKL